MFILFVDTPSDAFACDLKFTLLLKRVEVPSIARDELESATIAIHLEDPLINRVPFTRLDAESIEFEVQGHTGRIDFKVEATEAGPFGSIRKDLFIDDSKVIIPSRLVWCVHTLLVILSDGC